MRSSLKTTQEIFKGGSEFGGLLRLGESHLPWKLKPVLGNHHYHEHANDYITKTKNLGESIVFM